MKKIKLGKEYEDQVSGFRGIATAKYEFLNKCVRIQLTGRSEDGSKKPPEHVFDQEQMVKIGKGITTKAKASGGDMSSEPVGREGE